ncbi:MAG: hypothetical protein ACO1RT_14920 [Planctomycetaceae bacterium]
MNRPSSTDTTTNRANGTSKSESVEEFTDMAKEKLSMAASVAADSARGYGSHYVAEPAKDIFGLLRDYAKSKPDIAAMWCFGLGVIVGWKLRP